MAYPRLVEKATFRLPEWQLAQLRERSRRERRSLNAVVATVIAAGLDAAGGGDEPSAHLRALGSLLLRPASRTTLPVIDEPSPVSLTEALDWARGEW